jgi:hypothetical protein
VEGLRVRNQNLGWSLYLVGGRVSAPLPRAMSRPWRHHTGPWLRRPQHRPSHHDLITTPGIIRTHFPLHTPSSRGRLTPSPQSSTKGHVDLVGLSQAFMTPRAPWRSSTMSLFGCPSRRSDCMQTCHNLSYHGGFVREAFDFIAANEACSEES